MKTLYKRVTPRSMLANRGLQIVLSLLLGATVAGCAHQIVISGTANTTAYSGSWPTTFLNGMEIPISVGSLRTFPLDDSQYAICLSGGGYRATLFHAGVLARINQEGLLVKAGRIVGVSGGSITAAIVGLKWNRLKWEGGIATNFDTEVVAPILDLTGVTLDVPSVVTGALTPSTASLQLESRLDKVIFHGATLQDFPAAKTGPQILLLASEMRSGSLWVFSREVAGADKFAYLLEPSARVSTAVAASSGFPPVLAPLPISLPAGQKVVHPNWDVRRLTADEREIRHKWEFEVDRDPSLDFARQLSPEVAATLGEFLGGIIKEDMNEKLEISATLRLADGGILSNSAYESCYNSSRFIISSATIKEEYNAVASADADWLSTLSRTIDLVFARAESAGDSIYQPYLMQSGNCPAVQPPKRRRCGMYVTIARDDVSIKEDGFKLGRERASIATRLKQLDMDTRKLIVNWGYSAANDSLVSTELGIPRRAVPFQEAHANWP